MGTVFYLALSFMFLSAFIGNLRPPPPARPIPEGLRGLSKLVWGRLAVFSNGVEVFYEEPRMDDGHAE
jgi:hypothetical protein